MAAPITPSILTGAAAADNRAGDGGKAEGPGDGNFTRRAFGGRAVLFNRTNSPELVGKTSIYRGERPAIFFAGYLIRINPVPELDSEYLNLCLNTHRAKQFCSRVKTDGVSQSNINAQKLGEFEVPFCSLPEQKEIVRRVETLFGLSDRLENHCTKGTNYVEGLTRAILAKAFRGELVATDAKLAEAESGEFRSAAGAS